MPLVTYQCENGHKTLVERDALNSPTIECSTCQASIDRFDSKNIVEEIDTSTGEIHYEAKPSKLELLLKSHWKPAAGFAVGLVAAALFIHGDKIASEPQAPAISPNQIEDIAYTQTLLLGKEDGVYNIHLSMTNTGSKEQNQPPSILVEFLKQQENTSGQPTWTRSVPTAIYPPSFYAPKSANAGFTQVDADLDIQLPPGTQAVVTCLTYIGVADMQSDRCQQKITEALSTAQTQGETK